MGGYIGLTVREKIYDEKRLVVAKTDPRRFINNIGLVTKAHSHIQKYLDFESPLKPDEGSLTPVEYGLIVVDYVSDEILTYDKYGGLGRFNVENILLSSTRNYLVLYGSDVEVELGETEYEINRIYALLRANKIAYAEYYHLYKDDNGKDEYGAERVDLQDKDLQRLKGRKLMEKLDSLSEVNGERCCNFGIDLSPFEITNYLNMDRMKPEVGLDRMKQRLDELGFKMSAEEEKLWEQYKEKEIELYT